MSIESLVSELASAKSFDIVDVRAKIGREFDAASTSEERGKVLAIFTATMDQAERHLIKLGDQAELLANLRNARAQDYKIFILQECTVGLDSPGGGDVSIEMLMAVTNREIAAGRMTEDHSMRKIAVEGAAAPHLSHADLVAKHANVKFQSQNQDRATHKTLAQKMRSLFSRSQPRQEPAVTGKAQLQEWSWRAAPGAYERHLQRRCNNPLFPAARRVVSMSDVLDARRLDDSEYNDLVAQAKAIDIPESLPRNWGEFLPKTREQLDELIDRAREIGGDTTQILDVLNGTRVNMIDVWRKCLQENGNTDGLAALEKAEEMHSAGEQLFSGTFLNQLRRKDRSIPHEELVPTLLCESAKSISTYFAILGDPERASAKQWAANVVIEAEKEGFNVLSIKEQLLAMGLTRDGW